MYSGRAPVRILLLTVCLATFPVLADADESADFYGEIQVLKNYEARDQKLGHVSFGALGDALDSYFTRKDRWADSSGLNWMIEVAPIFQEHIDGGGGFHANNETNLIGQWAIRDKTDAGRGNLIMWYQVAATWGGQTTTELMDKVGILSPPNGGDTYPADSRDLTQHFAWEQKFAGDRIRVQVGKMTTRILFNLNRYTVSDREDFLTPMIVNNPVASYTARVGFGAFVEYKQDDWYVSGMIRDADANLSKRFIDFDSLSTGNWEYVGEFGYTPGDLGGLGPGNYRLTISQSDATATVPSTSSVSLSFDQDIGERVGAFFRYATADDTFRAFDRRVTLGAQLKEPLGFANDRVGLAIWRGDPADTTLRTETGIDFFWKLQIADFLEVSAGLQMVLDPAIRTDRSKATLATIRLRMLL